MEMKGRRYWIEYAKDKCEEMNHVMVKDYEKIFKHLFLQLIEKYLKIVLVDSIHEKNIEKKYPLFLKKFEKQIEIESFFVSEVYNNLIHDQQRLNNVFRGDYTKLKKIECLNSDLHNNGKCVLKFVFQKNKLIYKPRGLSMDKAWDAFSRKLFTYIDGRWGVVQSIDCITYGWQTYIEYKTVQTTEEISRYYYNFGSLAAVLYILNGTDFHEENVIVFRDKPYILDLETLLQNTEYSVRNNGISTIFDTALFCAKRRGMDISSYSGMDTENKYNLIQFGNQYIKPYDYLNETIRGFWETGVKILENIEFVTELVKRCFSWTYSRIIIRDTLIYDTVQKNMFKRMALSSDSSYEYKKKAYWKYLNADIRLDEIIESEMYSLENGDIPYFSLNSTERQLKCNNKLLNVFYRLSPLENVLQKINNFSFMELRKQEILLVKLNTE